MLGAGSGFQVLRMVTLQAAYERRAHLTGQVRVFTLSLLAPTPTRVTKDINIGRPESKTLIPAGRPIAPQGFVMLGAGFVADG